MYHDKFVTVSVQDTEDSNLSTSAPLTPTETLPPDIPTTRYETDEKASLSKISLHQGDPNPHPIPSPGSTYLIRATATRHLLTLHKGHIQLLPPDSLGSPHWECTESGGWLGFRNLASYDFLGRDAKWGVCCVAKSHREWERFHLKSVAGGGGGGRDGEFVLLMTHWGKLRPIGVHGEEDGVVKFGMVEGKGGDEIVWEFVKV